MQHLAAKAIEDREADVGAVLARIDIHAKRPLAERRVDDPDDGIGHGRGVRVGRHYGRNGILHLLTETGIRPRLIFGHARVVSRPTGMGEVVGAPSESAGHDDRSLDGPAAQFPRIDNGHRFDAGLFAAKYRAGYRRPNFYWIPRWLDLASACVDGAA